jgi:hypothetical protein
VNVAAVVIGLVVCVGALIAAQRMRPSVRAARADRTSSTATIDPFGVGEPWRRHVAAAQAAQRRFTKMVRDLQPGPLRTRLVEIGRQVEHSVDECWQIARRGDQLDATIRGLDGSALTARLERATDDKIRASLQSQLDSLQRIRDARNQADGRLNSLSTQLGEIVSQAAEISAGADATDELGTAVVDIVAQLEALNVAIDEVNNTGRSRGFEANGPGSSAST